MRLNRSFPFALIVAVLLSCASGSPARADAYVKPSTETLLNTLVRFGAIDLMQDKVLDAYTQVMDCDVYLKYFSDEFKWQKVRPVVRDHVKNEIATYPTGFRYETKVQLGRYDFKKKIYPFTEKAQRFNINAFSIDRHFSEKCRVVTLYDSAKIIPTSYKFVLASPINIDGLPLDEKDGNALFNRMEKDGNVDHMVYARINLRVTFIAPIDFKEDLSEKEKFALRSKVLQSATGGAIRIDSRLDSIEYYEDEAMTRLVYLYRP